MDETGQRPDIQEAYKQAMAKLFGLSINKLQIDEISDDMIIAGLITPSNGQLVSGLTELIVIGQDSEFAEKVEKTLNFFLFHPDALAHDFTTRLGLLTSAYHQLKISGREYTVPVELFDKIMEEGRNQLARQSQKIIDADQEKDRFNARFTRQLLSPMINSLQRSLILLLSFTNHLTPQEIEDRTKFINASAGNENDTD